MAAETMGYNNLKKNDGAVLVTALLMMVVLSIMSSFAMTVSMLEQKVALNSEVFQHNFYAAEAVMLEGAAALFLISDEDLLNDNFPAWLAEQDSNNPIPLNLSAQWTTSNPDITPQPTSNTIAPVDLTPIGYTEDGSAAEDRLWYAALSTGACDGANLAGGEVNNCYEVYGLYDVKRVSGRSYAGRKMMMVKIGRTLYP